MEKINLKKIDSIDEFDKIIEEMEVGDTLVGNYLMTGNCAMHPLFWTKNSEGDICYIAWDQTMRYEVISAFTEET